MLVAQASQLQAAQVADAVVLILGSLCGVGFVLWLSGGGRWRNPLAGCETPVAGPNLAHVAGVLLLYVLLGSALMSIRIASVAPDPRAAPGAPAWHLAQAVDGLAKLAAVAVAVGLLPRRPPRTSLFGTRLPLRVIVSLGVLGALIVTPLCTLQLQMTTWVWKWVAPDWVPPLHPVLEAIKQRALDDASKAHLLVGTLVVAPLAEELFFRGLLLPALWRYTSHAWISVLLSGLLFGSIHFQQPQAILPLATLGIAQGYLRVRTASLLPCVIVHALFNGRTMIMALFFPEVFNEM